MSDKVKDIDDEQEDNASTKKQLINLIATNLYKYVNSSASYDMKSLIMLTAALTMVNASDDTQAINTARRLTMAAVARPSKNKTK